MSEKNKPINALDEIEAAHKKRKSEIDGANSGRGKAFFWIVILIIILICAALTGGFIVLKDRFLAPKQVNEQEKSPQTQQSAIAVANKSSDSGKRLVGAGDDVIAVPVAKEEETKPDPAPATAPATAQQATGFQTANEQHQPTPEELAHARKLKGSFRVQNSDDDSSTSSSEATVNASDTGAATGGMMGGNSSPSNDFASRFDPAEFKATKAKVMKNRDFMLTQGELIPCILNQHIDTTVEGMITCYTKNDVWSVTGKVKLMERHTKVTGMISAPMKIGSKRIFALWNRFETPNGVIANIGSPVTDSLGTAGVDGYVDTHWGERFGNALLISFIEDAVSSAFSHAQNSNTNINLNTTQNTTSDIATEALKNSISIPPTLTKNQGEIVSIYVARDIDFSDVYSMRAE